MAPCRRGTSLHLGLRRRIADVLAQCRHEIDDLAAWRGFLVRRDDLLPLGLLVDEFPQRCGVMGLELLRREVARLAQLHGKVDHFLVGLLLRDILEERRVVFNNGLRNACQTNQINERNSTTC